MRIEKPLLERAARALCTFNGNPENTKFEGKPMWQSYLGEARAMLAAIREPSKEEKCKAWGHPGSDGDGHPNDLAIYQAMINAALD